ncbi:hypothetical protein BpHYR1_012554 [Brachionus plicatilis]|uniref:Uncharacterized protein n=1 Tax=Brachionus plicatilis TaxID=10195 RepID=A0A3M7PJ59_BRAPC|nr:hypothetical protein BpHYR1_012554 [Brachionus plicatilis]
MNVSFAVIFLRNLAFKLLDSHSNSSVEHIYGRNQAIKVKQKNLKLYFNFEKKYSNYVKRVRQENRFLTRGIS